jgi:signal transduction histidine kinase
MFAIVRRRLGLKLFFSYLVVIVIGSIVLVGIAQLAIPAVFSRHLYAMSQSMSMMMGGHPTPTALNQDLYNNFQQGVVEALTWATLAAFITALFVSWFVSRQVVLPIRQMMAASQRIAEGRYAERVAVPGNIHRDELDELAQLALSFNQMAARLDQVETMRSQLIGDVAHELRTPLTLIKGTMEGLIDGVLPTTPETFHQVQNEAERLQRLVADLQELSRVEAGELPLNSQSIPVEYLLQTVSHRLGRLFETKGVILHVEASPKIQPVLGNEDRILQVLVNIVGNALNYTPSGGQVWVTARQQEKQIEFIVKDTGMGIPAEHLPHIFTRFYRVDKSRSRNSGGSGIGLTIARRLVEAYGGRIWVESQGADQGSTFFFTLPSAK